MASLNKKWRQKIADEFVRLLFYLTPIVMRPNFRQVWYHCAAPHSQETWSVQCRPGQYGKESLGPGNTERAPHTGTDTHTPAGQGGDGWTACILSVSRPPPTPHLSSGNGVARLPGRNSGQKAQGGNIKKKKKFKKNSSLQEATSSWN